MCQEMTRAAPHLEHWATTPGCEHEDYHNVATQTASSSQLHQHHYIEHLHSVVKEPVRNRKILSIVRLDLEPGFSGHMRQAAQATTDSVGSGGKIDGVDHGDESTALPEQGYHADWKHSALHS